MASKKRVDSPEQEVPTNEKTGSVIPVFDFIFGLLDRIFKNADGSVMAARVAVLVVLFIMALIWFKGEAWAQIYKQSRFETYAEIISIDKDKRFDTTVLEQLQIVHVSSNADFSAVYNFRPKNFNYFVDMTAYEGKLPETIDPKNLGGFPIDKTSEEYQKHLAGANYESSVNFVYLPTTQDENSIKFMYSCPYFNLDNVYSGAVAMYWYETPKYSKERLQTICGQASRAIGRTR